MNLYLVSMSFGPVQEFIAAARRTADLYAGSNLLLDIVGPAAATFPDPVEGFGVGRIFPLSPTSGGANKILAIVNDPEVAVDAAKAAAREAFIKAWDTALAALNTDQQALIDLDRARDQITSFLEVYAAWVPVTSDSYADARRQVERLLAGRKALRDFLPSPADDAGILNSTLDPSRPSVVTRAGSYSVPDGLRKGPLFLKSTETLDGVSLLKRLRGRALGGQGTVLSTRDLAQRTKNPDFVSDPDTEFIPDFPYYCVLVGDGDRMGELLNRHNTPDDHREISGRLDKFADSAREFVDVAGGVPVYTGGDDVLALLPVTEALECARSLSEEYAETMQGESTLSVGVAVAHYLDPLSSALDRARQAERAAKVNRDSLAVALHKRNGNPLTVESRWDEEDLTAWAGHFTAGHLSRGLPYELHLLSQRWPASGSAEVLADEVSRIIRHSQPSVSQDLDLPGLPDAAALRSFAEKLLVARFLTGETA